MHGDRNEIWFILGDNMKEIPEHLNRLMKILHHSRTDKNFFGTRWKNLYHDMCLKATLKFMLELDDELREHYKNEPLIVRLYGNEVKK